MTTTQALQNLQDEFRHMTDKAKATVASVTQLRNAKKEGEIKNKRQELLTCLKTMQESLTKLQQHMQDSETHLEEALSRSTAQEQKPDQLQTQKANDEKQQQQTGYTSARNLSVEQQEALYELKSSCMGVMKSQTQALKRESEINKRRQHLLKARHARNESYSGSDTLRAVHALECKVRAGELKIKELQHELHKSQQMALKYRQLYEDGQRDSQLGSAKRDTSYDRGRSTKMRPKSAPNPEQSFVGPSTNINDVVRKNECLLEENEVLQREVQRLKRDNAELILMTKSAAASRDSVLAQLSTSEMSRRELLKRYNKVKHEKSQLSRSMTRQTAEWIEGKKQQQHLERQLRWSQQIGPVAPHGSKERFREHPAKENVNQPRQMYPVESYA